MDTFFKNVLPEYVEPAKHLLDEKMRSGEVHSFIVKAKRTDGKVIDILLNAQVIKDEAGKPLKLIGTTLDITKLCKSSSGGRRSIGDFGAFFQ